MMGKEIPYRTCIGCRESFRKNELLRFVLTPDSVLVPDLMNKLPGRGAYTCIKASCIHLACERKQFSRAFKKEVLGNDPKLLHEQIIRLMENRIASYIALANKAGKVVSGSDMVMEVLRKKSNITRIILLARDISDEIGTKVRSLADLNGTEHATIFDKERFGELLGKGLRSVISVQGEGFVDTLKKEIERYRYFLRGEGCTE